MHKTEQWLFQNHSPETLLEWVRSFQYGYFLRAVGGHASDYDELCLELIYRGGDDLDLILKKLHLEESLTVNQGGWTMVEGLELYVWVGEDFVTCSFSGRESREVTEIDVEHLLAFEKLVDAWGWQERVSRDLARRPQVVTVERILESL